MQVYITDVSDEKIQFAANGEECVLSPLFASSITVKMLPEDEPLEKKYQFLSISLENKHPFSSLLTIIIAGYFYLG